MVEIKTSKVEQVSREILKRCGVPMEQARVITSSIIYAHSREKHSHGIGRLPIYVRKIKQGLMSAKTNIKVLEETLVISNIDANNGFGQVAGAIAMERAIDISDVYGIGVVGVRNSNNFGAAGFLGEMAANKGFIGIVLGNSAPAIAPHGGKKALLGTNPLCVAFPCGNGKPPIVLDMACSVSARGKIRLAKNNNQKIPLGWALDQNGNPTTNPIEALKGTLVPIGGHKGYGLSLIIDILAGLLTGSAFGGEAKPLNYPTEPSNYGHMVIVMNPSFFMDYETYLNKMNVLVQRVKFSDEQAEILILGEKSFSNSLKWKETIELPRYQVDEINLLSKLLGMSLTL